MTSRAGLLAVLKTHAADIKAMKKDAATGAIGTTVRQVVATVDTAFAAGNANDLNSIPSGASVDTYCGVDGEGVPLPKYFAAGKRTSFCATFLPVFQAVENASTQAGAVAALVGHKTQVSQAASELSGLPSSIKAKASTTLKGAQTAIATNSAAALGLGGTSPAPSVAIYCGQNQ